MPPQPTVTYATLTHTLPPRPYILNIHPSPSGHLILRHPSPCLTLVDPQTLQSIDTLRDGHGGDVTDVAVDQGAVWSSGKDANVIRWDERSRRAATTIKAFVRKPLPVTAVTASDRDSLVVGGTELVSSEAHILFWDVRNTKAPAYSHTSTHSDDITHLSLLPSTSTFLPSSSVALPDQLLLSSSTDGLVALSDLKESDEDEAVQAAENWGQSIAACGAYAHRGVMKVWGRSDMDAVATWDIRRGADGELELGNLGEFPADEFKFRDYLLPSSGPSTVHNAAEEQASKENKLKSDYLIDVVPSLGISSTGAPITALGTNGGDIIIQYHCKTYVPTAFFLSGPSQRGHKDVVRCLYHDVSNEALYTGSEDGVLSGWSLAGLPERLRVGDKEVDDDGGDGREDLDSDDEEDESEIESETNEEEENGMDVDEEDEERRRYGPILGGRGYGAEDRKEKRRGKRVQPY